MGKELEKLLKDLYQIGNRTDADAEHNIRTALKESAKFKTKTFELLDSALKELRKEDDENSSLLDMFILAPTIRILEKIKQELLEVTK